MVSLHEDLGELRRRVGRLEALASRSCSVFTLIVGWMQIAARRLLAAAGREQPSQAHGIKAERGLIRDRDGRVLVGNRAAYEAVLITDLAAHPGGLAHARRQDPRPRAQGHGQEPSQAQEPVRERAAAQADVPLAEVAAIEAPQPRDARDPGARHARAPLPQRRARRPTPSAMSARSATDQLRSRRTGATARATSSARSGLEARYESWLRGRDGSAHGGGRQPRPRGARDGPADPGASRATSCSLRSTSTSSKAGEDAFGDNRGAAVVMDVKTGAVLAMYLAPALRPQRLRLRHLGRGPGRPTAAIRRTRCSTAP